jgi:ubiquinone/menaquinone biosynthesis C-methylase UbiE
LDYQPDAASHGRIFEGLRRFLRKQFGQPTGLAGRLAGRVMANSASNQERSEWTLSLLDIQAEDRVLEIGFGPGLAIEIASRLTPRGFVGGVDHSPVMVEQAARRNAVAVAAGRVVLRQGSAGDLPTWDQPFDKIFTINSIHFWEDPVASLRVLRGMLKPGGSLAVTLQPRSRHAEPGAEHRIAAELAAKLKAAGFTGCRTEICNTPDVTAACVIGSNAGR